MLGQASGRVLDLGAGTGGNFEHIPSAVTEMIGVEPDPFMLRQAKHRAEELEVPVRLLQAVGEQLPFPDERFDCAVVTLVLCTVDDLDMTVGELRRVLRPGGRLLLMEHVRAHDEALARWQDRLQRPWYWFNGGCHPNRRTVDALRARGFRLDSLEVYGFPALPHVQGLAVRP